MTLEEKIEYKRLLEAVKLSREEVQKEFGWSLEELLDRLNRLEYKQLQEVKAYENSQPGRGH